MNTLKTEMYMEMQWTFQNLPEGSGTFRKVPEPSRTFFRETLRYEMQ